jgi:crotonobetainyl-CoA:carnitine CoA-transferase CaiB-like acyl-CoA transferase
MMPFRLRAARQSSRSAAKADLWPHCITRAKEEKASPHLAANHEVLQQSAASIQSIWRINSPLSLAKLPGGVDRIAYKAFGESIRR